MTHSAIQHAYEHDQYAQDQYAEDFDFNADLSVVDENAGPSYELLPPGRYRLMATNVALKDARSGGKMVAVTFQVTDGQHERAKLFENFNLQHRNHQTVEIAQRQVKQWLIACGFDGNQRLTMGLLRSLEGREFYAHVIVSKSRDPQYGDSNRIQRYEAPQQGQAPQSARPQQPPAMQRPAAPVPQPQAQQQYAAGGNRPWVR